MLTDATGGSDVNREGADSRDDGTPCALPYREARRAEGAAKPRRPFQVPGAFAAWGLGLVGLALQWVN